MRLFDFVEQDDAKRAAAHGFGELPAFVVAHIARRRSDEAGYGVLFHVLGHVQAHDVALIVKQVVRKRARQFGLAHAGGA